LNTAIASRAEPFVGLRPFDTGDAAWFFGRGREAAALTRKLRTAAFTAVVGPSGSGKSSIVRAGVVPLLQQDGWREIVTKPGSAPLERLARALASATPADRLSEARRFRFDSTLRASAFGLADIAEAVEIDTPRLLLVVDQFEELFRYGDEATGAAKAGMREESRAFVELLLAATRRKHARLHVCVTMRSDFFGACSAYEGLAAAVSASQFLVPLPGREQLEEAIRKPVEKADAVIEEALVQRLLVDVEEETDQLPLLQHTLRRLWEIAGGDPRTMREADYVTVGRIAGSIDRKAEAMRDALGQRNSADPRTLELVMKALTDLDVRDRATRRPQRRSELVALLLDRGFADRRGAEASLDRVLASLKAEDTSFVQLGDEDDPEIDIGHEALIRSWTRLAGPKRDFAEGWLREERNDGEKWREYVRRASEGPRLSARERKWVRKHSLSEAWSRRYGNRWQDIKSLIRRSFWHSALWRSAVAISLLGFAYVLFYESQLAVGAYQEAVRAYNEALQSARLTSLSLADRARVAAREGDARLAALLARAALPVHPSTENPRFVEEAEIALADALARPMETMRTYVLRSGADSVFFSMDGTRMVSVSGNTLQLRNAVSGDPIGEPLEGHSDDVNSAAFSADGRLLVSASDDKTLRLWDAATGEPIGEPLRGHTEAVKTVAFSPDGKRIVSASDDRTLRLWDPNTGMPIGQPLRGHTDAVNSVAFSPDGKRVVSASDDTTLRLWDPNTGKPIGQPLRGHTDAVKTVTFSPDGKRILSESENDTLLLWDALAGKQVGVALRGNREGGLSSSSSADSGRASASYVSPCLCAAFSPDGTSIVSATAGRSMRLWDAATGRPIGEPLQGHTGRVASVTFSSDGKRIVSTSSDDTLRLWDAITGKSAGAPLHGHTDSVTSAVFLPDGTHIVSVSQDKTLRLWEAVTTRPVGAPLQGHASGVFIAVFSPDGTRIVSASEDKTLRLWNASTGEPLGVPFQGHAGGVYGAAFSPDGTRIVSGSADKTLRLWDAATGKPIGPPLRGHTDTVNTVAFSPDGRRIVSASDDKTLRLWDAATGKPVGEPLQGHTGWVIGAAFSPDGRRIVSASDDKTLRLWDAATGKPVGEPLQGHTGAVISGGFSPDGKLILSASRDKTLLLWDAATGQHIGALQGHTDIVYRSSFSPDGKQVVSASQDGTVRLWDVATRTPVGEPLQGHTGAVISAVFSPDGKRIVSASLDHAVRLWETAPKAAMEDEVAKADKLCPLDESERRGHGLSDPRFPETSKEWTAAQRRACGLAPSP
jgi:WD40 repeat protein